MTETPDLARFLSDRWDEEEQAARAAQAEPFPDASFERGTYLAYGLEHVGIGLAYQAHVLVWDPARVLAEIAAKRAILDRYQHVSTGFKLVTFQSVPGAISEHDLRATNVAALRLACLLLAAPYADHPAFRPEWRVAD